MPLVLEQNLHRTRKLSIGVSDLRTVRTVAAITTRSLDTRHHDRANCGAFCRLRFLYVTDPMQTLTDTSWQGTQNRYVAR